MDFGTWGKNGRKMGKSPFFTLFWANSPIFQPFFLHFPGKICQIHLIPPFFPFRARHPKWQKVQGNQDRKRRMKEVLIFKGAARDILGRGGKEGCLEFLSSLPWPCSRPAWNRYDLSAKSSCWAELKGGGGAKRTEKQNLARMACRKPFFETLRKWFLRRSAEGNSGHF